MLTIALLASAALAIPGWTKMKFGKCQEIIGGGYDMAGKPTGTSYLRSEILGACEAEPSCGGVMRSQFYWSSELMKYVDKEASGCSEEPNQDICKNYYMCSGADMISTRGFYFMGREGAAHGPQGRSVENRLEERKARTAGYVEYQLCANKCMIKMAYDRGSAPLLDLKLAASSPVPSTGFNFAEDFCNTKCEEDSSYDWNYDLYVATRYNRLARSADALDALGDSEPEDVFAEREARRPNPACKYLRCFCNNDNDCFQGASCSNAKCCGGQRLPVCARSARGSAAFQNEAELKVPGDWGR